MLAMAGSWLRLAEQAEKNSASDLVYETPPAPRCLQMMLLQQQQQQQGQQRTLADK